MISELFLIILIFEATGNRSCLMSIKLLQLGKLLTDWCYFIKTILTPYLQIKIEIFLRFCLPWSNEMKIEFVQKELIQLVEYLVLKKLQFEVKELWSTGATTGVRGLNVKK